jgi:hypothetical protein
VLPNKFVAGGIISKLPPSWKDFATSLKHKRQESTFDGLIGTLDVEEKARANDTRGRGLVGASANFVQKNNSHKNKKKPPQTQNQTKTKQTTTFKKKKKKKGNCYVCKNPDHFAGKCPHRKGMKSANMVIGEAGGTWSMVIHYLQFFQYFVYPSGGLTLGLIFMCVLIFSYFLLTRSEGLLPC